MSSGVLDLGPNLGGGSGNGATGLPGPTGPSGGAQGATGVKGVTGIQGSTGVGARGATGLQGPTGLGGPGATGVGSQGATGVQGITGPGAGAQGVTGLQGQTGVGLQGQTGIQGTTGVGLQGNTGAAGSAGSQGATGLQGQTGLGLQGVTGLVGTTGIQGQTGVGIQGITGVAGSNGTQGTTGVQGQTGLGIQGQTGAAGTNGSQGATGVAGQTGTSVQGQTGIQGVTGISTTSVTSQINFFEDYLAYAGPAATASSWQAGVTVFCATGTHTGASIATPIVANHPGILRIGTGTSGAVNTSLGFGFASSLAGPTFGTTMSYQSADVWKFEIMMATSSTATGKGSMWLGLLAGAPGLLTTESATLKGIYWELLDAVGFGTATPQCWDGTTTTTGTPVTGLFASSTTFEKFTIQSDGSTITYLHNGVSAGTVAVANTPSATGMFIALVQRNNTSASNLDADYISWSQTITR